MERETISGRADMMDSLSHCCEDRFHSLEGFFVAPDEEDELTALGLRKCPCDRRVTRLHAMNGSRFSGLRA
jgi:hypothetical protein